MVSWPNSKRVPLGRIGLENPFRFRYKLVFLFLAVFFSLLSYPLVSPAWGQGSPLRDEPAGRGFTDLTANDVTWRYMAFLRGLGVVNGFPDGSFQPQGPATRAQAAKMVATLLQLPAATPQRPTFTDVRADHWAYKYIEAAKEAGIWRGYPDGSFAPEKPLSRAEAAAILLRLAGQTPAATAGQEIAGREIPDVPPEHWARVAVSEALDAGLLPPTATGFSPGAPASRVELARGLALVEVMRPERSAVEMQPQVKVLAGEVWLTSADKREKIGAQAIVRAGDTVETGVGGRAEVIFDDGSSLLLEPQSTLYLDRLTGYRFIGADGREKAGVDQVEISLRRGTLFGALATNYVETAGGKETAAPAGGTSFRQPRVLGQVASLSPLTADLAGLGLAAGQTQGSVPWYRQAYTKKVRVRVNMPWGVAGIRGTFWKNEVTGTGFSTSVLVGEAEVTAAGQTVELAPGQYTLAIAGQPPAPPQPMPAEEKRAWAAQQTWVEEKAKAIEENRPVPPALEAQQAAAELLFVPQPGQVPPGGMAAPPPPPPPPPAEAPRIGEQAREVLEAIGQVAQEAEAAPPQPSAPSGGGGGGGPAPDTTPPQVVGKEPADGASGVALDAAVSITFNEALVQGEAFSSIAIRDAAGNAVANVSGSISGRTLTISHASFNYGTTYTVTVPAGAVKDAAGNATAQAIVWGFTTAGPPAGEVVITGLRPAEGPPGSEVKIEGHNFGSGGQVAFGGAQAAVKTWSDTSLTVVVPQVQTGQVVGVTVTSGGVTSNAVNFLVTTPPLPPLAASYYGSLKIITGDKAEDAAVNSTVYALSGDRVVGYLVTSQPGYYGDPAGGGSKLVVSDPLLRAGDTISFQVILPGTDRPLPARETVIFQPGDVREQDLTVIKP